MFQYDLKPINIRWITSHCEKSCIALYYRHFPTKITNGLVSPCKRPLGVNTTGFNFIPFFIREKLTIIRCDKSYNFFLSCAKRKLYNIYLNFSITLPSRIRNIYPFRKISNPFFVCGEESR